MTDFIEKTEFSPDAPIGVFDSGMGGVRVLKDLAGLDRVVTAYV